MRFVRPINTHGKRPRVTAGFSSRHPGYDYAEPEGEPVYAKADGDISFAKGTETRQWIANQKGSDPYYTNGNRRLNMADFGNRVEIDHGDGYKSREAHLQHGSLLVKKGDKVKKGQMIARIGSTGNSSGNHLHSELRRNGVAIDFNNMIDKDFTNYFTAMTNTIEVEKPVFEHLVGGATVRKEFSQWLRDKGYGITSDPDHTPTKELQEVVGGIISAAKTCQTDLSEANTEIDNLEDKAANEETVCQIGKKVVEDELATQKDRVKTLEKQVESLKGDVTNSLISMRAAQRQEGLTKKELAKAHTKIKQLQSEAVGAMPLLDLLRVIVSRLPLRR